MSHNVMRGLVFRGPGEDLAIEELELDPPGEGEVLVRMVASGVCHSDLHVVDGEWERPANVVLGHEGAAVVDVLGPNVPIDSLREGDLVVLAWTAPCGSCVACQRAEPWLCTEPRGSGHRLREEAGAWLDYGSATPAIDFPRIAALYADSQLPARSARHRRRPRPARRPLAASRSAGPSSMDASASSADESRSRLTTACAAADGEIQCRVSGVVRMDVSGPSVF